jgi:hypothetical protein
MLVNCGSVPGTCKPTTAARKGRSSNIRAGLYACRQPSNASSHAELYFVVNAEECSRVAGI